MLSEESNEEEICDEVNKMFNTWMMATNFMIMAGVWPTFICLVTGII